MQKLRDRTGHVAVIVSLLFLASIFFFFFFLFLSGVGQAGLSRPFLFLFRDNRSCQPDGRINATTYRDELDEALSNASMGNKTVIITIVNEAYVESNIDDKKAMLDMFLDSFWVGQGTRGLTDHLLIVAVDSKAYERCKFLRLHCYRLAETRDGRDGGSSEKMYMSGDFIDMMWMRTQFLGDVLKHGYNFVFTDADVMWLRNPLNQLTQSDAVDLQISTDKFNGRDWSEKNPINTGFYYIRSNNRTIALVDAWYASRHHAPGLKEQDVLEKMMRPGFFRRIGLRVKFLDTRYFSGFCQDSKDVWAVKTVHANCCRTISAKLADLTVVIRDWKRFRRSGLAANETMTLGGTRHMACRDSWRGFNITI